MGSTITYYGFAIPIVGLPLQLPLQLRFRHEAAGVSVIVESPAPSLGFRVFRFFGVWDVGVSRSNVAPRASETYGVYGF